MPNENSKDKNNYFSIKISEGLYKIKKYKYIFLILLFISILIFTSANNIGKNEDNIRIFYISICGTFAGALAAFLLTMIRESDTKKNKEIVSINFALFILARQFRTAIILQNTCNPHKEKNELIRAIELPAMRIHDTSDLIFPYGDLSFLLLEKETVGVLHQLGIAQDSFCQMLEVYNIRNVYYVETIQPIMEEKEITKSPFTLEEIEKLLGDVKTSIIISNTNEIYDFIETCIRVLDKTQVELIAAGKKVHPRVKFPKFSKME